MKIIDLTHIMHKDMPVFPGMEKPKFLPVWTVEKNGFAETDICMYSHTGTHIDAPAHMLQGRNSLDKMEIEHFIGGAIILDCTDLGRDEIKVEDLLNYESKLKDIDFVIIKTGWSKYWESENYLESFPFLTIEAAEWLISFGLKGIGIDTISIDDIKTTSFPIHYKLFGENMIVIENLTNLDSVKEEIFMFSCLPIKYENADGSPVRAIAIENII